MSKKVLVIYYTQSGQLRDILDNFSIPLIDAGVTVEKISIKPINDFPFPWTSETFFDAMPESVLGIPIELQPIQFKESTYDLVVLGYQPWFLSPSIPTTSLLVNPAFKAIIKDTPVVTIIGSRNMWLNAQEKVKKLLSDAGANRVGNIMLMDKHNNHVSAVTILYWMLTGKKDRYLNIFPKPGVSYDDITNTRIFGQTVNEYLQKGAWDGMQTKLVEQKAVVVKYGLMFIESKARKLFSIWANTIIKRKNRKFWLVLFKYYLLFALFIVAPIVLVINTILFRPFFIKNTNLKKQYFLN